MKGASNSHKEVLALDDQNIIALYWARSETAISETAQKYGGYCFSIAKNILTNHEDAEESVNDTYLKMNSQADGVKSYGRMVDLMLSYRFLNENLINLD